MKWPVTAVLVVSSLSMSVVPVQGVGLFLSEVIEGKYSFVLWAATRARADSNSTGSRYNKIIEIYNPTNMEISLVDYMIWQTSNQQYQNYLSFPTGTTIRSGGTYTLCHSRADAAFVSVCDFRTSSRALQHNGNDIIRLIRGTQQSNTLIDIFGKSGADTSWDICGIRDASENHGARRKPTVVQGNTNWDNSSGTNDQDCEWIVEAGGNNHVYTGIHECILPPGRTNSPTSVPTPPTSPMPTMAPVVATTPPAEGATLIISEVVEGSSFNKVIEIFNPTNMMHLLSEYMIKMVVNGGTQTRYIDFRSAVFLAPGEVYTLCNPYAAGGFRAVCDYPTTMIQHDGNDAIQLVHGRPSHHFVVDTYGDTSYPGPWEVCGRADSTRNAVMIRKPSVYRGTVVWNESSGTDENNCQWIVVHIQGGNNWTHTGNHSSIYPIETSPPSTMLPSIFPTRLPSVFPTTMPSVSSTTMPPSIVQYTIAPISSTTVDPISSALTTLPSTSPSYNSIPTLAPTSLPMGSAESSSSSGDDSIAIAASVAIIVVVVVLILAVLFVMRVRKNSVTTPPTSPSSYDNPVSYENPAFESSSLDNGNATTGYTDIPGVEEGASVDGYMEVGSGVGALSKSGYTDVPPLGAETSADGYMDLG